MLAFSQHLSMATSCPSVTSIVDQVLNHFILSRLDGDLTSGMRVYCIESVLGSSLSLHEQPVGSELF